MVAFLSGIILVSDYGCKGEDNKITTMLYDRYFIYKTVKSSHLKKLQIIININIRNINRNIKNDVDIILGWVVT